MNNKMLADSTTRERRPLVVELVGPAGVGKTTLLQTLSHRNPGIQAGIRLPKTKQTLFWLSNLLFWLPTFLRQPQHSRWFTLGELRSMVYLKAWHQVLEQQPPSNNLATILDHGPIFRLVLLHEFGSEISKSQIFERWWHKTLNQWAATLDMVIWLEAPEAILLERIRTRNCWHTVKGKSQQEGSEFLARYRKAYEQLLAQLTANSGLKVHHFNTNEESPEQIASKILLVFDSETDKN